ncbi:MAG: hypothetical protein MZV70_69365 [Desulfobacterales bacterium]|nr:hypothetical protein [Desulfobacterales bacterium]
MAKFGLGKGLCALIPESDIEVHLQDLEGRERRSSVPEGLRSVPLGQAGTQPLQPRKTFDETALEELAASIRAARHHPAGDRGGLRGWDLPDRGRGEKVQGRRKGRTPGSTRGGPVLQPGEEARDLPDRERPARGPQPRGGGRGVQDPDGRGQARPRRKWPRRSGRAGLTVANALRLAEAPVRDARFPADRGLEPRACPGHPGRHLRRGPGSPVPPGGGRGPVRPGGGVPGRGFQPGRRPAPSKKPLKPRKTLDADLRDLEQKLIGYLGTKVILKGDAKKGSITIDYFSMDDLERVFDLMTGGKA